MLGYGYYGAAAKPVPKGFVFVTEKTKFLLAIEQWK